MSQNDPQKTPTTIKIAPKEASKRNPSADPGPGDPSAAPSVAPELVEVPSAPTGPTPDGAIHDVDEEGEGEVEHPDDGTSPSTAPASPAISSMNTPSVSANQSASKMNSKSGVTSGSSPTSDVASKSTSKMSAQSPSNIETATPSSMVGKSASKSTVKSASNADSAPASSAAGFSKLGSKSSTMIPSDFLSGKTSKGETDNKKKVTKFRYHKRITVRTSGKTSPSAIMAKVSKKDHQAGITPSTIEDLDPKEIMRRAGIKGNKKTHWRVRLRQTKRLTKNGKTTTQTKVAYRDSEGNKRVKTSSNPFCKSCGKKLEECKCDSNSQSQA